MTTVKLKGRKCGMTQRFDGDGNVIPCTVIQIEPNIVTQVKTVEKDGYSAIQLATDKVIVKDPRTIEKRVKKPQRGHFERAGVAPHRHLHECRLPDVAPYATGQEITVDAMAEWTHVDVTARTKGKGYQGVMKKYGFAGGPASHGSGFHRHAGSTGHRSTPGRCFPGGPRPSHMGHVMQTTQSLKVVAVDQERGVLIVKGAVPGPVGGSVLVAAARKKMKQRG